MEIPRGDIRFASLSAESYARMTTQPPWVRGPVAGVPALLQPVAHALIDADEDVQKTVPRLSVETLWTRPGGAASVAYHVTHAMGSLDRLLTYARGESLSETQLAALAASASRRDAIGSTRTIPSSP
jgi:hypothetical protein